MRKLNEYVITILTLVVLLVFMSTILLGETDFFTFFKPSDWLNVISNIFITIFTVGVTIYIFETGDKRQRLKNEQENKPIVILGVVTYEGIDISRVVDLEESEVPLNELKNDSNVKIPLINGGKTPIFHVNYSFDIENIEEIKKYYHDYSKSFKNKFPKLTFTNKIEIKGFETDNFKYSFTDDITSYNKSYKIARFSRDIPAIMPQKETPVKLPLYYIVLLYDYFINPRERDMPVPILKMYLNYKDSNMKKHEEEYLVELHRNSMNKKLLNYTLIGSKLNFTK